VKYYDIMLNVCCIQLTVQQVSNLQDIEDTSNNSTCTSDIL